MIFRRQQGKETPLSTVADLDFGGRPEQVAPEQVAVAGTRRGSAGLYLAALQFLLTVSWTVYVVYLPQLAERVGIPVDRIIVILIIDQVIFTICDTLMGIATDRMIAVAGRFSRVMVALGATSCAAFLALPYVVDLGPSAEIPFLLLIGLWAVTSSALRAPPIALMGKFAARPSVPWLCCLAMCGYGLAGASAPYLGATLRAYDPRWPFLISSAGLMVAALSLPWIERQLRRGLLTPSVRPTLRLPRSRTVWAIILIPLMIVLAIGYQFHFALDSVPLFLRFTKQPDLKWMMPVYWIGFSFTLFPVGFIVKRLGGFMIIGCAALLGAAAILGMRYATNLDTMLVMQFVAGAAWGAILTSAMAMAIALGNRHSEGIFIGLIFSAVAIATGARLAAQAIGIQNDPTFAAFLHWVPILCWSLSGVGLLALGLFRLGRTRKLASETATKPLTA